MSRPKLKPEPDAAKNAAKQERLDAVARRKALRAHLIAACGEDTPELQAGCMVPFQGFADGMRKGELSKRSVSPKSIEVYKGIWLEWLMYLVGAGVSWREAKPVHVGGFLRNALRPRNFARHADGRVSEVTQARYAKVLEKVYLQAIAKDEHLVNPVSLKGADLTVTESVPSLKLHQMQRAELLARLPEGQDVGAIRDRLVICLTLLEGMTCADIMGMKLGDLLVCPEEPESADLDFSDAGPERLAIWGRIHTKAEGAGGSLLARGYAPAGVHLLGERPAQERRLGFTATTRGALLAWLNVRGECSGSSTSDVVVLSLSRRKGERSGGASYRTLFQICSAHINTAMKGSVHLPAVELQRLKHIGPNALRNACLLEWLEVKGLPPEEVCRRAGLKETRSLLWRMWKREKPVAPPEARIDADRAEAMHD